MDDGTIRKFFPSLSKLTYSPVFSFIVDASDKLLGPLFFDYGKLPPNHLRIRVGVGNRLFNNQARYLTTATNFWYQAFCSYRIGQNACIIDLGCGCGRYAHHLQNWELFSGQYIGVDIDEEQLHWCRSNFDNRFRFHLSNDASASYVAARPESSLYVIPEPDQSADLVFSASLFTHLLEPQLVNYLNETYRLLKPGAVAQHSVFLRDHPPSTIGKRHRFSHKIGNAHVESLRQPEAAVAYDSGYLLAMCKTAGFSDIELEITQLQSYLILKK